MADIWPTTEEIDEVVSCSISAEMFASRYADVFSGDDRWQNLPTPEGELFAWDEASTYIRRAPYFDGMPATPEPVADVARCPRAAEARRLGHHRPHLAPRVRSRPRPRPGST